jgi:hypothetical protein
MTDKELKETQQALANPTAAKVAKRLYFTTGHVLLDLIVGGGPVGGMGYPSGTICRDHGDSGTAKSFKATELIAASRHKFKDKFRWRYCDPEHGNTINTEKLYGFDIFDCDRKDEDVDTVQDWDYDINRWLDSLKDDECGIYVLDSLDSLMPEEVKKRKEKRWDTLDKGKEFDEGTYAMEAQKFLSQEFFRGLTKRLEEKHAMLYVISQERDNVNAGLYAAKNRTSGGRAIGFYETVRINSKLRQKMDFKGITTHVVTQVTGDKVRHERPYGTCFVSIIFNYGLDNLGDCIDYLYDLRTDLGELKKSKKGDITVNWDGTEYTRDQLIQFVGYSSDNMKALKEKVCTKWEDKCREAEATVARPNKY